MRLLATAHRRPPAAAAGRAGSRSGAALLLAVLLLMVLIGIVIEIGITTSTEARVARNDVGLSAMDLAVESALLQVGDTLKLDGESAGAGGASPMPGAEGAPEDPGAAAAGAAGAAGGGQGEQPVDSRRDEWALPQRTEINEVRLRIFVQDEDSKVNVLGMLVADEEAAQEAYDRVVRVLDLFREGTEADVDLRDAEEMARAMRDFMQKRSLSQVPRAPRLSDDQEEDERALPLALTDFAVLEPFETGLFRDFRDENGQIVHSIESFLTVWSSVTTAGQAQQGGAAPAAPAATPQAGAEGAEGGEGEAPSSPSASLPGAGGGGSVSSGGWAVNVNTAPPAVLKALFDGRDVHPRFWDRVIEYRNLEEEEEDGAEEVDEDELPLDEWGQPMIQRRIFEALAELEEVDGWDGFDAPTQARVRGVLTTESQVFSIYLVARRPTSSQGDAGALALTPEEQRLAEENDPALVRCVRSVVWRREVEGEIVITPLVRWQVLDYVPHEVLDYPEEDR